MVSDVAARGVYQVAITNNGACLKGTVTLVMKLPETSEPFGLACDDSQLYVPDSSREGGKTKLNLATLESDKLVSNGSEDCHTVHGLAVTKKRHLVFTDRGSRTVRLQLSQQDTRIEIQTIAGSGLRPQRMVRVSLLVFLSQLPCVSREELSLLLMQQLELSR